jgi:transposase
VGDRSAPRHDGHVQSVQAAWERHGLKSWIEAAKKRMHHNVLAIALANKLARIAWAVLNKERNFECTKTNAMEPRPA